MDKLLISALSGSNKAKYYLDNFPKKFTMLSGVYFEQYDDDIRMLKGKQPPEVATMNYNFNNLNPVPVSARHMAVSLKTTNHLHRNTSTA